MRGPSESKSASQNSNNSRRSHLKRRMSIWFRPLLLPSSVRAHCSFANIPLHDIVKTIPPNRITGATLLNYLLTHCSAALIHNNWEYWHWWQRGTGFNRNILCIAPEGILIITWFKKICFRKQCVGILFCKIHKCLSKYLMTTFVLHGFFCLFTFFFCIFSLPEKTGPIYNFALSQRAKQSELGLGKPREVNNRLGNNYTADSSHRPHLQELVNKQTKLPALSFNHVFMPGTAVLLLYSLAPDFHFINSNVPYILSSSAFRCSLLSSSVLKMWSCWWVDLQYRSYRTWEVHTL